MVARKFTVFHKDSNLDIDYDTEDGFEVFKFQLFSLTAVPPDQQKIFGCDPDDLSYRIVSDDSDLASISDKLRLVSIDDHDEIDSVPKLDPEVVKSDEEIARMLQCCEWEYLATCGQMDNNTLHDGSDDCIFWNTDDELEVATTSPSSPFAISTNAVSEFGESSSSSSYPSKLVSHFMSMGYPASMVIKVIRQQELGENDANAILDTLVAYSAVGEMPQQENEFMDPPHSNIDGDFSDLDSNYSDEDADGAFETDDPLVSLIDMGYSLEESSDAISRCGKNTSLGDLVDFLSAAHLSKEADAEMDMQSYANPKDKKRKSKRECFQSKNKKFDRRNERKRKDDDDVLHLPNPMIGFGVPREIRRNERKRKDDDDVLHLPNPMIGFGVPREIQVIRRRLPNAAIGPPYFLYENVALTPKGVWSTIKNSLYKIEPEFVDSKYFCVAARKRGYVHNLPLEDRYPIQPLPPRTIFEALPETKKWWPSWDKREQLNCILTCIGTAQLTERIRLALQEFDDEPSLHVKKYIIGECKKWNMVWTGKTRVAPLEPDEIEQIMGYPKNHTRGASRVERYKGLGNAFQVDTVAYQLSVLKNLYPDGINVLSLFSGIGGAEVALHRLGVHMKNVVSVEKSAVCRSIVQDWWEQTNQKGMLIHVSDVQDVTREKLQRWIRAFGGFDLVIGGSPCNNLAGGNRLTRDGLEGEHSSLFYEYVRILDAVKSIMGRD